MSPKKTIDLNKFLVYRASAGSGKTYTIALLSIAKMLLSHGKKSAPRANVHRRILAVTFTNDATDEMKRRILQELWAIKTKAKENMMNSLREQIEDLADWSDDEMVRVADEVITDILHDYGNLHIVTIDSFLQSILRQLAHELHVGSRLNLDLDTDAATADAVRQYISKAEDDAHVREELTKFLENNIEDGKSWDIKALLTNFGKKIFNETYQSASPDVEAALKHDPKLFEDVRNKCIKIISDFKQAIVDFGNEASEAEITDPGVSDNATNLFRKLKNFDKSGDAKGLYGSSTLKKSTVYLSDTTLKKKGIVTTRPYDALLTGILKKVVDFLEKNTENYQSAIAVLEYLGQFELLSSLSTTMHDSLKEEQRFMLSDTAFLLSSMIQNDDAPFIFERMDAVIDNVLIDEAQDTSKLQWRIFETFVKNLIASGQFGMMVGDVKQSIYRWRNSDWHILNDIQSILGLKEDQMKSLDNNWRSYVNVVEGNNYIFEKMSECYANLFAEKADATAGATSIHRAYEGLRQTPRKKEAGRVELCFVDGSSREEKNEEQLKLLVSKLNELRNAKVNPSDICILVRTNNQTSDIAEYLLRPDVRAAFPELVNEGYFNLITDRAFVLENNLALTLLIESLRYIAQPSNEMVKGKLLLAHLALNGVALDQLPLTEEERDSQLEKIFNDQNGLEQLRRLSLLDLVYRLIEIFDLNKSDHKVHSAYLYTFLNAVAQYADQHVATITDFLGYWDSCLSDKKLNSSVLQAGVQVMTIHGSKGLEYHSVIVPFVEDPLTPKQPDDIWCKVGSIAPFDRLPVIPVKCSESKLINSVFKSDYLTEVEMAYMDVLNIRYVAFTRAKANLIAICNKTGAKDKEGLKKTCFSNILYNVLDKDTYFHREKADGYELFALGDNFASHIDKKEEKKAFNPFATEIEHSLSMDFQLFPMPKSASFVNSKTAQRFFDTLDEQGTEPTHQNTEAILEGVLNHSIYEQIQTRNDVPRVIKKMVVSGQLDAADEQAKIAEVLKKIDGEQVRHWFDGSWRVFNECPVIFRDHEKIENKRPDRVMVSDNETLVIDYKFGEKHNYAPQVQNYMRLMESMGYPNIKGYIWYVNLDNIEEVTL